MAPEPSRVFRPDLLDGQVAVVTGGGTNLGKHAARELLACGARVVIVGRREEVLADAVAELGPDRCRALPGDIRDPDEARRLITDVIAHEGRLDVLVNNAGGQYFVPAEGIEPKGWGAVQRLNVGGTSNMLLAAAAHGFDPERGGTCVQVTVSPHHGMPAMAHTGFARAAVEALGADLDHRWRDVGITVVSLAIGRFATESLQKYPKELLRDVERSVPIQRLGTLEEFGWAVALLASPVGRAFGGSVVTLDGGLDDWPGAWPPANLVDEAGEVPTEERRASAS